MPKIRKTTVAAAAAASTVALIRAKVKRLKMLKIEIRRKR